ncbi:MAG: hypothetical protein FJW26_11040 [Acidimicrobiia bacterium]|nr:hypothetical protein [Acidimicrobiia bacterium]
MKKKTAFAASLLLVCVTGMIPAHPHFNKSVTAAVKGLELKLTYFTLPYNAKHLEGIKEGFVFHCGRAKLSISSEVSAGSAKIVAGTYLLRAKATSADRWTLVLIPEAEAGNPQSPDLSKGIALETTSLTQQSDLHHLDLNLTGGHGASDGKLLVTVAFGSRRLEAAISLPAPA